jgi:hypothetical protein
MSAYDNDPRVTREGDGTFSITSPSGMVPEGFVRPARDGGGFIAEPWEAGFSGTRHPTADEAIHWLIGDPQ